jgi:hypothetical protein
MPRNVLFLLGTMLTASVCQAAVIYTYTLDLSFSVAGDHTISWTSLYSCCPLSSDVTTSEGPPVGDLVVSQLPTELRVFF